MELHLCQCGLNLGVSQPSTVNYHVLVKHDSLARTKYCAYKYVIKLRMICISNVRTSCAHVLPIPFKITSKLPSPMNKLVSHLCLLGLRVLHLQYVKNAGLALNTLRQESTETSPQKKEHSRAEAGTCSTPRDRARSTPCRAAPWMGG